MPRLRLLSICTLALACGDGGEPGSDEGTGTSGTATSSGSTDTGPTTETGDEATSGRPTSSSGADDETGDGTATDPSTTASDADGSSGGSEDSGGVLPRGQWAVTEVTYTEGAQSETLTMQDRTFCDATLAGGALQLRYQQQGGYTVWLLNLPEATAIGQHALTQDFLGVYMNINEVSDAWQAYFDPSMAFGTLTLTDADVQPGGVVAGTLTATLSSVDGTTTADFESTFYAEIP